MKNVIIVGGGLGGLRAAAKLSQDYNVMVLESASRETFANKMCAKGLSPWGKMLVPQQFWTVPVNKVVVTLEQGINISIPFFNICTMVDRENYLKWSLSVASKAGAIVCHNVKVNGINLKDKTVKAGTETFDYDILIGADGSHSVVRRKFGLPTRGMFLLSADIPNDELNPSIFSIGNLQGWFAPRLFGVGAIAYFPNKDKSFVGYGGFPVINDVNYYFKNAKKAFNNMGIGHHKFTGSLVNSAFFGFNPHPDVWLLGDAAGVANDAHGEGIPETLLSADYVAEKIMGQFNQETNFWFSQLIAEKVLCHFVLNACASGMSLLPFYLPRIINRELDASYR